MEAWTAPEELGGELVHIANVNLLTDLITSTWGDEVLHFQHRRVHHDWKFWKREWKRLRKDVFIPKTDENTWGDTVPAGVWPDDDDMAEIMYNEQVEEYGCPFAWLLQ